MRSAILSVKLLKTAFFVVFLFSPLIVRPQSVPLPNAFAHNDYFHKRPLFDALENGYTNIEADVFLENDELIVAHINPFFRSSKTLESLYLKPLADIVEKNGGEVYKGYHEPVILMIDIKTGAEKAYKKLKRLLEKYSSMLSAYKNGRVFHRAITIVLSGHKPFKMIKAEDDRMAFIDEDLRESASDTSSANVYKLASCKYSNILGWDGSGEITELEKARLSAYVKMAHRFGKKVRLWASPEKSKVWEQLLKCGVDLINTDKLADLKNFLLSRNEKYDDTKFMITNNTK